MKVKYKIHKNIVKTIGSKEWERAIKAALKDAPNFKLILYPTVEKMLDPKTDFRKTPAQIKNLNNAKQILLSLQGHQNVNNDLLE